MHESARHGLMRIVRGAAILAALVLAVVLLLRGCPSEADRISDAVDDARDALEDRRTDDFLAFFTDDVVYQGKPDRRPLERDVKRWVEIRVGRISILEPRTIEVEGTTARIVLRCDVGNILQSWTQVDVTLRAEKGDDGEWRVVSFDWKQ